VSCIRFPSRNLRKFVTRLFNKTIAKSRPSSLCGNDLRARGERGSPALRTPSAPLEPCARSRPSCTGTSCMCLFSRTNRFFSPVSNRIINNVLRFIQYVSIQYNFVVFIYFLFLPDLSRLCPSTIERIREVKPS